MAKLFEEADDDGILLAEQCIFKPGEEVQCIGGSSEVRRLAQEMDELFPTYDASGQRITPVHRFLSDCTDDFSPPSCIGSCSCGGGTKDAKCKARKLKCKAGSIKGLRFPFMDDPTKVVGLLSGGDIELIEFYPPPLEFAFGYERSIILHTPPTVELIIGFEISVTVEYSVVLDTKGIRQAVEEKNPLKALNSFAFRDTFDGVDLPLIVFEAGVTIGIQVSAAVVAVEAKGGITFRVEIDFYDPFPETSGGLIRPFELLALGYAVNTI